MRVIDLIHRWTGGLIGLLLAAIGLSGAILIHKDAWLILPHANDALVRDAGSVGATISRLMADPAHRPDQINFASGEFGLHRLHYTGNAGAYADQAGGIVAQWQSQWARPELWIFDLHHALFAGETGATVAGLVALVGLGFIVTGSILWWRLRKSFAFRLWPARMSRPAILRHHRDTAIVLAPLLCLSLVTGAMLNLKPVAELMMSPWTAPAQMRAALAPPAVKGGPLAAHPDWSAMLSEARRRFPDADFRILTLPQVQGDAVVLRMRQPAEWLPNGRTTLWFAADSGKVLAVRDGLQLPKGQRIYNILYTLHSAKVDGLPYRLVMTCSGLGLSVLGTLAVWSFWFRRNRKVKPAGRRVVKA